MRPDPDRAFAAAARLAAAVGLLLPAAIVLFLALEATRSLAVVSPAEWLRAQWFPTSGRFGLAALAAASAAVTVGALLIAAPVAVGAALFAEAARPPRVGALVRRIFGVLAGVPSVVFGLFGLGVVVPLLRRIEPPGASLLAGSLVLAAMIAPTAFLFADAGLRQVPRAQRLAAEALGLGPFATALRVLLPQARRTAAAGIVLAAARALGETMVVTMVCGNVVRLPGGPFDPVRPLTANIALEMAYASGVHRSALFLGGLVLVVVVLALVLAAAGLRRRETRAATA